LIKYVTWAYFSVSAICIYYEKAGDDSYIKWADGNKNFDNIWDDRASLTYKYWGE